MILDKYTELMEKVQVTPEMKKKLLKRIETENITYKKKNYFICYLHRNFLPMAACFVLICTAILAIWRPFQKEQPENPQGELTTNFGVFEAQSASELSEMVGFPVSDIKAFASTADTITWLAYGTDLAEIDYESNNQTICYRKSVGTEDNSGDYNEYALTNKIQIGTSIINIKGNDGKYNLAVWNDDTYSYSINLSTALSKKQFIKLLKKCVS